MESDIKNMLRYAMLSTFLSFGGAVYELFQFNWAAMFWAIFSMLLSIVGYSVVSMMQDQMYANGVDNYESDTYNTTDDDEYTF